MAIVWVIECLNVGSCWVVIKVINGGLKGFIGVVLVRGG